MKKLFSILTVVLILAGMLHLSVARHYCGGELAATKVSLSGRVASCGMEGEEENCPADPSAEHIKSHCCDDVVNVYFADSVYTPAGYFISESFSSNSLIPGLPVAIIARYNNTISQFYADVSPPGCLLSTSVDLSDICVFRI